MKRHYLKTHPEAFQAVREKTKPFEFRKNDRGFKTGHKVTLEEYVDGHYTGRQVDAVIGFVLHGPTFGVPDKFCVFGLLSVQNSDPY